jgi:hypothetical protein
LNSCTTGCFSRRAQFHGVSYVYFSDPESAIVLVRTFKRKEMSEEEKERHSRRRAIKQERRRRSEEED